MFPTNPPETDDELSLFAQAQAGSGEAFGELVRRHQGDLRWFLSRYFSDPSVVDDVAQEVFLAAVRQFASIRSGTTLRAWLWQVARCKVADQLRKKYQQPPGVSLSVAQVVQQELLEQLAAAEESEADESQAEHLQNLRDCLQRLKEPHRQIIQDYYFGNETAESISQRLKKSAGSIRMALVRIRTALRECLEREQLKRGMQ
jgi:RNA polymerase sigma-70 factor (ECF subfamily)